MKKTIAIFAAAMMLSCTFVSCGSSKDDDKSEGIVGKWEPTEETMKDMFDGSEDEGWVINSTIVEFTADNKMIMTAEYDFSSVIQLKDSTITWSGNEIPYTYDGKTIDISGLASFVRTGDADESTVYGEYTSDAFNTGGADYKFNFVSADKTTANYSQSGTYEYDEKEGTLTSSLDDGDAPAKVKIEGNKLTITDDDGDSVFTRVK
ncbi:MAG: hypothetical protein IKO47_00205 [Ruminococcus sp.]|nr:hypothetical protein [Ruminococcus sp.]